jgi:hypothetical protein
MYTKCHINLTPDKKLTNDKKKKNTKRKSFKKIKVVKRVAPPFFASCGWLNHLFTWEWGVQLFQTEVLEAVGPPLA